METVLITGCSSGIGAATARTFLDNDWRVYATARNEDDLDDLADAGCETAALDVTDGDQPRAVVDRVIEEEGHLDCLVNNAGYGQFGPVEDTPIRELHRQFDVNVYGPHRLARAALPHMREAGEGTIVNLSSVLGRISHPGGSAYCGSKAALEAMSDALRGEVAEFGIDVVVVEPGFVETAFQETVENELRRGLDRTEAYETLYEALADAQIVGASGPLASQPADVADAILDAATCADPPARIPVGTVNRWALRARYLPDRWRDAAFRLVSKFV